MPQISPISWVVIPFFFIFLFFVVFIGFWWLVKVGYFFVFSGEVKTGSFLPSELNFVWKW